jgi:predicted nucleic acid-binding protein
MNYLDANFVAALHFNVEGQSALAEKMVRKTSLPFLFSDLAELECRHAFILRAGHPNSENWFRLSSKLDSGEWIRFMLPWEGVAKKSAELMDKYGTKLKAGTLDTLHVAVAILSGCTWFLSFDTNSSARVLAASARLKIYPALAPAERGRTIQ